MHLLSSFVCRHNGFRAINLVLLDRSFWIFNKKMFGTELILGIYCFQTWDTQGAKMGGFVFGKYYSSYFDEIFVLMNSLGRSPSENFIAFIYYVTINIFDIGAVTKDRFPTRAIFLYWVI